MLELVLSRPEVQAIAAVTPEGEIDVMADALYKLFRVETGSWITNTQFGNDMKKDTANP